VETGEEEPDGGSAPVWDCSGMGLIGLTLISGRACAGPGTALGYGPGRQGTKLFGPDLYRAVPRAPDKAQP